MGAAVKVTRLDHSVAALRGLAAKSSYVAQSRRLLAIAMVLDGASRDDAARWDGPPNLARLGESLQPNRRGWPSSGRQAEMKQRAVQMMRQDPQMRQAFINQVAAPIANKLFECGLIP